jgi:hypothetical protein
MRLPVAMVVLALVGGCAYMGSGASPDPSAAVEPSPSPTGSPTASPSPEATPTPPASTSPEPSAVPTPSVAPSHVAGRDASNRFWNDWYDTCWFGAFPVPNSLREMVASSDVVLRGPIADLFEGGPPMWPVAYAAVEPLEVLKGDPVLRAGGTVAVGIGRPHGSLAEIRSQLPDHDNLWFMKRDGQTDRYYPTDYVQISVLRDIDGEVRVIWPRAIRDAMSGDHYPLPLEGTDFEELVQRVRDLTDESARHGSYAVLRDALRPESGLFAC